MKHYLIYQIRNKLNSMIYVGKHMTEDINDGYMGSGLRIRRAIEKYGPENFEKTILFECISEEEMNKKEAEIVNEDFIARDDVYNIKLGGEGGWDYLNGSNSSYPKGSNKRHNAMVKANKNRDIVKSHQKALKTRQNWSVEKRQEVSNAISEGIKRKLQLDKDFAKRRVQKLKGRKASKQLRQKLSELKTGENNNQYGKVWIMNKALRCCKCVDSSYVLPDGWEYGRCLNFDAANQKKIRVEKRLHAIEQHKNDRLMMFRSMYKFFVDHNNDFELTAKQFNYSHTRNAFMTACRILLPEYKPLPNNRWKNRK